MRDLRLRFGVILALALLPLFVFSIWRSFEAYEYDKTREQEVLTDIAIASSLDLIDSIDTAKNVLRTLDPRMDIDSCAPALSLVTSEFQSIDNILVANAAGSFECALYREDEARKVPFRAEELSPAIPFLVETRIVKSEGVDRATLTIWYGNFDNSELQRIFVASAFLDNLAVLDDNDYKLTDGSSLALVNSKGDILIDPNGALLDFNANWLGQNGPSAQTVIRQTDRRARYIIVPTTEREVFVVVKDIDSHVLSWQLLNPMSSGLIPILAWLFAFIAIWISTDLLILKHLRKLQRSSLMLARGNMDERVGDMSDAPQKIAKLGHTFNLMADKIAAREDDLKTSLSEKELLLREVHHRVKNNLQIVISLLNIQERKLKDPSGKVAINEARNRINAIALVHAGLYSGEDLAGIEMRNFLPQLCSDLGRALGLKNLKIETKLDVEDVIFDPDTAIPVALFMVESLTNTVKHGMGEGDVINISLKHGSGLATLIVKDSGHTIVSDASAGTGEKLMAGFARQLAGHFRAEQTSSGYVTCLEFPLNSV